MSFWSSREYFGNYKHFRNISQMNNTNSEERKFYTLLANVFRFKNAQIYHGQRNLGISPKLCLVNQTFFRQHLQCPKSTFIRPGTVRLPTTIDTQNELTEFNDS